MQHQHSSGRQWAVSALLLLLMIGYIWFSPLFPNALSGADLPTLPESVTQAAGYGTHR